MRSWSSACWRWGCCWCFSMIEDLWSGLALLNCSASSGWSEITGWPHGLGGRRGGRERGENICIFVSRLSSVRYCYQSRQSDNFMLISSICVPWQIWWRNKCQPHHRDAGWLHFSGGASPVLNWSETLCWAFQAFFFTWWNRKNSIESRNASSNHSGLVQKFTEGN